MLELNLEKKTVECPHCHEQVKANTSYCPLCFRSLVVQEDSSIKTDWKVATKAVASLCAVIAFSFWMWYGSWEKMALGTYHPFQPGGVPDPTPAPTPLTDGDEAQAYFASEQFVEDKLKAPASAKFPFYPDFVKVGKLDEHRFTVTAYVDSQNTYGAMLRTDYVALMRKDGKDWFCEGVTLKPR